MLHNWFLELLSMLANLLYLCTSWLFDQATLTASVALKLNLVKDHSNKFITIFIFGTSTYEIVHWMRYAWIFVAHPFLATDHSFVEWFEVLFLTLPCVEFTYQNWYELREICRLEVLVDLPEFIFRRRQLFTSVMAQVTWT